MKILIIEDEELLAKELEATIEEEDNTMQVIDVLPSLKTARRWFLANAMPDIVFMDVQLSDGISFTLFDEFRITCPVVFTTAYDQYAVRAFKVNGVDYLLKPVLRDDLRRALEKCKAIAATHSEYPADIRQLLAVIKKSSAGLPSAYKEKFIVHVKNQWMPVNTREIACFMKENLHYIITHTGEKYILSFESMEEIEELLDPTVFYRANRQFIIHIDAIHSVRSKENSKLTVSLKPPVKLEIDISRDKAPDFRKWMDR
ncbi:MAG TPA: LytTR family DNA-binding domain-containing protein [Chitinophagaceae bacterium]|nr:LytTR family DNA-binding domain-containing protein [Chitinophagaceae bacterium]